MFPVTTNFPAELEKHEETIIEDPSLLAIDQKIEELRLTKLYLLGRLPMAHSVWGERDNPMSWKLVTRVADGCVYYKGFLTGPTQRKSYEEWNSVLLSTKSVEITKCLKR